MRRWMIRSLLLAVTLSASGCSWFGVHQQPLASDQRVRPQKTDHSLVLGGADQQEDSWVAHRNDGGDRSPRQVYYGPSGKLYYDDGSPVKFDSVRKQLQDRRSEANTLR